MTTLISGRMITDKLAKTSFTKIVLLAASFLAIFLYFCALAIGSNGGVL
jgi:hypothetical protein